MTYLKMAALDYQAAVCKLLFIYINIYIYINIIHFHIYIKYIHIYQIHTYRDYALIYSGVYIFLSTDIAV